MIPQLRAWHERYEASGLTIVGVHSPEFLWERSRDNVASAPPSGWACATRWSRTTTSPSGSATACGRGRPLVLVDRTGIVRFRHIGEGAYEETESLIQQLLAEGG